MNSAIKGKYQMSIYDAFEIQKKCFEVLGKTGEVLKGLNEQLEIMVKSKQDRIDIDLMIQANNRRVGIPRPAHLPAGKNVCEGCKARNCLYLKSLKAFSMRPCKQKSIFERGAV